MTPTLDALSLAVTAAGLACLVLAVLAGHWRAGIGIALDLWIAAGLLRLAVEPGWDRILAAGAIILLRRLLGYGLRSGRASPDFPPAAHWARRPRTTGR